MSRRSFSEKELAILAAEATNYACSRGELVDWEATNLWSSGNVTLRLTLEVIVGAEEIDEILGGEV